MYEDIIKRKFEQGIDKGYSNLMIIIDKMTKEIITYYVKNTLDINLYINRFSNHNFYKIKEIYNFNMNLYEQLNERISYNIYETNSNKLVNKALYFATIKHKGQTRIEGTDYITHPIDVANLVEKYFPNNKNLNTLKCVSYLHDTLEDTKTTYEELITNFGIKIANLVLELTNNKQQINKIGKTKYLENKMLHMSEDALNIKLCDRLSNILSLYDTPLNFQLKYIKETLSILEFLDKYKNLSDQQQIIIIDIIEEIKKEEKTLKKIAIKN